MLFPFEEIIARTTLTAVSHAPFLKPIVAFFGSVAPWLIAAWFIVEMTRIKSFKLKFYYFALAAMAIIISRGMITEMVRNIFYVSRPFETLVMDPVISSALTSGMPSGHMALLFPIALTFISMKKKKGIIVLALVMLVGAARIVAGVHWLSDILVGLLAGEAGFLIARAILPKKLSIEPVEHSGMDETKQLI